MNKNFLKAKYLFLVLTISIGSAGAAQARQQQTAPVNVVQNKPAPRRHLFASPPTGRKTAVAQKISNAAENKPAVIEPAIPQKAIVFNASLEAGGIPPNREISSPFKPELTASFKTTATGGDSVLSVSAPAPRPSISDESRTNADGSATGTRLGSAKARNAAKPATEVYRAGTGDVLDIRLLNAASRESTLYTILNGGLLDYPLAGEPLNVAGMTIEEVSELLAAKIKLYDRPEVSVTVRDYSSHKISVSGLVEKPGIKSLRREAVPLFAILAEAVQQPDALQAVIVRPDKQKQTIDLNRLTDEVVVRDGDAVRVFGKSAGGGENEQFYFMGGFVQTPGEKVFHIGLTLTQAVLAAGGATKENKNRIIVFRQNAEGLLVKTEFNLKLIKNGKALDPFLLPGDRIEIGN